MIYATKLNARARICRINRFDLSERSRSGEAAIFFVPKTILLPKTKIEADRAPTVNARRARHTRPNETNQVAASSAWSRQTARHPWFRSDRSMSAKVTTDLPFGTATTL